MEATAEAQAFWRACVALLNTFYASKVASAIFYSVVCWGSSISTGNRKTLNRLIRMASSVLGCPLDPVKDVSGRRMMAYLLCLLNIISNLMQDTLTTLNSSFSDRLLHPWCGKKILRLFFQLLSDFTINILQFTAHTSKHKGLICKTVSLICNMSG